MTKQTTETKKKVNNISKKQLKLDAIAILKLVGAFYLYILLFQSHSETGELYKASKYITISQNNQTKNKNINISFVGVKSKTAGFIRKWWDCDFGIPTYYCDTLTNKKQENETSKEELKEKMLTDTQNVAIYFAMTKAKKNIDYLKVESIYKLTGEKIINIKQGNNIIYNMESFSNFIANPNIEFEFNNKEDKIDKINYPILILDFIEHFQENTNKKQQNEWKVNYSNTKKFNGNSAGLMWALYIYAQIIDEDITKGRHIAGTGSLTSQGAVRKIGQVKAKVQAGYDENVDLFFVPIENCPDAREVNKPKKVKTELVCVAHFDDVLEKLKK